MSIVGTDTYILQCGYWNTMEKKCELTKDKCIAVSKNPLDCTFMPQDLSDFVRILRIHQSSIEAEVRYFTAKLERAVTSNYKKGKESVKGE